MAKFLALTSKGLGPALSQELSEIDIKALKVKSNGVLFESNWSKMYEAQMHSRISTRFLLPVLDFAAYNQNDFYANAKKHDFTKYLKPNQTFMVVAKLKNPGPLRHQVFISQLMKDVIVDQFYERYSVRPDVDKENPDVKFYVKVDNVKVSMSVDTTGDTLSKRGYRFEQGAAPVREHLAAGLLTLSGWNRQSALLDPMCGSGTFLIEAAMMKAKQSLATERPRFSFQNFSNYRDEDFKKVRDLMVSRQQKTEANIFGFDQDFRMVEIARRNVQAAGLESVIKIRQLAIKDIVNDLGCEPGMIVANPPYGVRLVNDQEKIEGIYQELGDNIKKHFSKWDLWILSGNPELTKFLHMKAQGTHQVFNGAIECRWLRYKIN